MPVRLGFGETERLVRIIENGRYSGLDRISRRQIIPTNKNPCGRRTLRYIPESPDSLRVKLLVSLFVLAKRGSLLGQLGMELFKAAVIGAIRGIVGVAGARRSAKLNNGRGKLAPPATHLRILVFDRLDPLFPLLRLDIQHVTRRPGSIRERRSRNPFLRIERRLE